MLLGFALLFVIQFFLEGMHRTKLLPIFAFIGLLAAVICLPMANRLPSYLPARLVHPAGKY